MVAVIRMKLGDLLDVLSGTCKPFDEAGLKSIQTFLLDSNATRRDPGEPPGLLLAIEQVCRCGR